MRTRRWYWSICLVILSACTPAISGHVFYDLPAASDVATTTPLGIVAIPVELYLVKSYLAKTELKPLTPSAPETAAAPAPAAASPDEQVKAAEDPAPQTVPTSPPATGTLVALQQTDTHGRFRFGNLEPGEYEVRLADAVWTKGYRLTTQKNPIGVKTAFRPAKVRFGLQRDGLQPAGGECPETVLFPDAALCEQRYQNVSPVEMKDVVIAVTMDEFLAAIPRHGGIYLPVKRKMLWVFPVIKPNETITVGFVMVPQLPATDVATVSLQWVVEQPHTGASSPLGTLSTNITTTTAATVKISGPTMVPVGATFTLTIRYRNTGTRPLTDLVCDMTLPADAIHEQHSHKGQFDNEENRVTWTVAELPVGADVERSVTVTHAADAKTTAWIYEAHLASAELVEPVNELLEITQE